MADIGLTAELKPQIDETAWRREAEKASRIIDNASTIAPPDSSQNSSTPDLGGVGGGGALSPSSTPSTGTVGLPDGGSPSGASGLHDALETRAEGVGERVGEMVSESILDSVDEAIDTARREATDATATVRGYATESRRTVGTLSVRGRAAASEMSTDVRTLAGRPGDLVSGLVESSSMLGLGGEVGGAQTQTGGAVPVTTTEDPAGDMSPSTARLAGLRAPNPSDEIQWWRDRLRPGVEGAVSAGSSVRSAGQTIHHTARAGVAVGRAGGALGSAVGNALGGERTLLDRWYGSLSPMGKVSGALPYAAMKTTGALARLPGRVARAGVSVGSRLNPFYIGARAWGAPSYSEMGNMLRGAPSAAVRGGGMLARAGHHIAEGGSALGRAASWAVGADTSSGESGRAVSIQERQLDVLREMRDALTVRPVGEAASGGDGQPPAVGTDQTAQTPIRARGRTSILGGDPGFQFSDIPRFMLFGAMTSAGGALGEAVVRRGARGARGLVGRVRGDEDEGGTTFSTGSDRADRALGAVLGPGGGAPVDVLEDIMGEASVQSGALMDIRDILGTMVEDVEGLRDETEQRGVSEAKGGGGMGPLDMVGTYGIARGLGIGAGVGGALGTAGTILGVGGLAASFYGATGLLPGVGGNRRERRQEARSGNPLDIIGTGIKNMLDPTGVFETAVEWLGEELQSRLPKWFRSGLSNFDSWLDETFGDALSMDWGDVTSYDWYDTISDLVGGDWDWGTIPGLDTVDDLIHTDWSWGEIPGIDIVDDLIHTDWDWGSIPGIGIVDDLINSDWDWGSIPGIDTLSTLVTGDWWPDMPNWIDNLISTLNSWMGRDGEMSTPDGSSQRDQTRQTLQVSVDPAFTVDISNMDAVERKLNRMVDNAKRDIKRELEREVRRA